MSSATTKGLAQAIGGATGAAAVTGTPEPKASSGIDIALGLYFVFWYAGNVYYNISNKNALKATGGADGFPVTVATLQLGVGVVYALFLWAAPDARATPKLSMSHLYKMLPVGLCAAGSHLSTVFAMSAGAVSFGQIVKAAEPVFAAVVSTLVYNKSISTAQWLCLIPVVGGVCLASAKELDFSTAALVAASVANLFAAFKGAENKKLMTTPGLKSDLGGVGNQFAVSMILAFLMSLPVMVVTEGARFDEFVALWKTDTYVRNNVIVSGLMFYGYNELATMTLTKTTGVTQSVANTAKRVLIIVLAAIIFGESLAMVKMIGCSIGIGGVFLYSVIDRLVGTDAKKTK